MGNPTLLGCDVSDIVYAFVDGVNPTYPLSNLKTYYASDVARSATLASRDKSLTIDLGIAKPCSMAILDQVNSLVSWASVAIYSSDNGASYTLLNSSATLLGERLIVVFASSTKRYWKITVSWEDDNNYLQLGNAFIGSAVVFESSYEWDYNSGNKTFETNKVVSLDGRLRTSQSYAGRKTYDLLFNLQSDILAASFRAHVDAVRGDLRPFYFIDDDGVTVDYVHFTESYADLRRKRFNQNGVQIKLQSQLTS